MGGLKIGKRVAAMSCVAAALAFPAAWAVPGKSGTLTVFYSSAGPARPNGYENAAVDVEYFIGDCPGAIAMGVRRVRGSVKGSLRYWFEGQQLGTPIPEPDAPEVRFRVDVLKGGTVIKSLTFLASDEREMSCFGAMTQNVGSFSQFLPKDATTSQKEALFKELSVMVIGSSPMTLRNEALEAHFRKTRAEAARRAAPQAQAQAKAAGTDDFWDEKKPAAGVAAAAAKAPARKSATAAPSTDFWGAGTPSANRAGQVSASPDKSAAARAEEARLEVARRNEETVRQVRSQQAATLANTEKMNREVDRRFDAASGLVSAGDSAAAARGNIQELSQMNPAYESASALEQDYERRLSAIKGENQRFEAAQQTGAVALQEMYFGGGGAGERAVGAVAGLIASAIAQAEREEEMRAARKRLEAQREQGLRQLAAERESALLEMRRKLLDTFPDGSVPLSSERVAADTLFYFWYEVRGSLEQARPALTLGHVFPVQRRADGSWPFKRIIKTDIANGRESPLVLVGHFTTRELAEKTRSTFVRLAGQSQFSLATAEHQVKVQVDPAPRPSSGADMWNAAPGNSAKPASADFWK